MLKYLRSLLAGQARSELDAELRFHIEKQTEANLAAGMSLEEARRQAIIAFGGAESVREACHEQRRLHSWKRRSTTCVMVCADFVAVPCSPSPQS